MSKIYIEISILFYMNISIVCFFKLFVFMVDRNQISGISSWQSQKGHPTKGHGEFAKCTWQMCFLGLRFAGIRHPTSPRYSWADEERSRRFDKRFTDHFALSQNKIANMHFTQHWCLIAILAWKYLHSILVKMILKST